MPHYICYTCNPGTCFLITLCFNLTILEHVLYCALLHCAVLCCTVLYGGFCVTFCRNMKGYLRKTRNGFMLIYKNLNIQWRNRMKVWLWWSLSPWLSWYIYAVLTWSTMLIVHCVHISYLYAIIFCKSQCYFVDTHESYFNTEDITVSFIFCYTTSLLN